MTDPKTIIKLEDRWNMDRGTKNPLLRVAAVLRRGYMEEDDIRFGDLENVAKFLEAAAGLSESSRLAWVFALGSPDAKDYEKELQRILVAIPVEQK